MAQAFQEVEARAIFKQIIDAINFLHEKGNVYIVVKHCRPDFPFMPGIAHRDLKPENILIANIPADRRNGARTKVQQQMSSLDL